MAFSQCFRRIDIFKMLTTKEELITDKLISWLDDVNVLRNIILIFFVAKINKTNIMEGVSAI